jgi:hypothetical protein
MYLYDENLELPILDPPKITNVGSMTLNSPQLDGPNLLFRELGFHDSCWIVLQHFELPIPALACLR